MINYFSINNLNIFVDFTDRSGVNKFVKEFEESKEKLDLYCNKLSRCINDKRALIDMLSHSETYYDAAYEEAKVIVHVSGKFDYIIRISIKKVITIVIIIVCHLNPSQSTSSM